MLIRKLLIAVLAGWTSYSFAQEQNKNIDITFSKTTSLIFQYPIVNVDRGSDDVIAQKVKEVANTLQLKAARKDFPETNLTVITADGKLHHFFLNYSEKPEKQTFNFESSDVELSNGANLKVYQRKVDKILMRANPGRRESRSKFMLRFSLNGIYIDQSQVYYDLSIKNRSNVRYDVQSLRFFIRDKKKAKRTASQEIELMPSYVSDNAFRVNGHERLRIVFVLNKFTIPDAKTLDIELFEKNGGRHLKLRINNHTIVKAGRL